MKGNAMKDTKDTKDTGFKIRTNGCPYTRGGADYYYWRHPIPHYYKDDVRIGSKDMTPEEIEEYYKGYDDAVEFGDRKDWT